MNCFIAKRAMKLCSLNTSRSESSIARGLASAARAASRSCEGRKHLSEPSSQRPIGFPQSLSSKWQSLDQAQQRSEKLQSVPGSSSYHLTIALVSKKYRANQYSPRSAITSCERKPGIGARAARTSSIAGCVPRVEARRAHRVLPLPETSRSPYTQFIFINRSVAGEFDEPFSDGESREHDSAISVSGVYLVVADKPAK